MSERRTRLRAAVRAELAERDASAVVHVGRDRDPSLRYCLAAAGESNANETAAADESLDRELRADARAVALDGETVLECGLDGSAHPARQLADRLAERGVDGTVLAPPHLPHDAALYLEEAGFPLASTTVLERARAAKSDAERERIERAQSAASAGVRRGASLLADAATVDGRLALDGEPLSLERLRRGMDAAIVEAGAFPAGNTTVTAGDRGAKDALRPGEPIALAVAPRGSDGYRGGLARTVVVDGEGAVAGSTAGADRTDDGGAGWERRARVALTRAFASARVLLSAGDETIRSVEADLEAEIRAFGFDDGVRTAAAGVGLEAVERPRRSGTEIGPESVVRIDAAITGADVGVVRFADLLVGVGEEPRWLAAPERTLEAASLSRE